MNDARRKSGRLQFLLIAALFLGPLLIAAWLYYGGDGLRPETRSNYGSLLEPIVNLADELPGLELPDSRQWFLLYADPGPCASACRDALYTTRQSRLMLGKDMDRVLRVFLHGASPPDTLFLAEEHPGLVTLQDAELQVLLDNKKPDALPAGGFYLIDPHGNLVLYFGPGIDPRDMVDDIRHLLKLSRIG